MEYRIVRRDFAGNVVYAILQVDMRNGKVTHVNLQPVSIIGNDLNGLKKLVGKLETALRKPVIDNSEIEHLLYPKEKHAGVDIPMRDKLREKIG